jgi:hypothetical protein
MRSMARAAAASPALSPSKQMMGSGASTQSCSIWRSVNAVPSVATAFSNPA